MTPADRQNIRAGFWWGIGLSVASFVMGFLWQAGSSLANKVGGDTMIWLLLSLFVLGVVIAALVYLLRYMGAPSIFEKFVIGAGVLIALFMFLDAFGVIGTRVYYHEPVLR